MKSTRQQKASARDSVKFRPLDYDLPKKIYRRVMLGPFFIGNIVKLGPRQFEFEISEDLYDGLCDPEFPRRPARFYDRNLLSETYPMSALRTVLSEFKNELVKWTLLKVDVKED